MVNKNKAHIEITGDNRSAKRALGQVAESSKKAGKKLDTLGKKGKRTGASLAGGFNTARLGAIALYSFVSTKLLQVFAEQEISTKRLQALAKSGGRVSKEQVKELNKQADALQKVGIVGDEVILALQSQALSFGTTYEEVKKLTPAFLDTLVANKGLNATTQDAISLMNILGYVLGGNIGRLKQMGVVFTDAQLEMIKVGNQTEKLSALTEALEMNYGGLNEELAKTTSGGIKQAKNAFGDMLEVLVSGLQPALTAISAGVKKLSFIFQNDLGRSVIYFLGILTILKKVFTATFISGVVAGTANLKKFIISIRAGTVAMALFNTTLKKNLFFLGASTVLAGAIYLYDKLKKKTGETSEAFAKLKTSGSSIPPVLKEIGDEAKKTSRTLEEIKKTGEDITRGFEFDISKKIADEEHELQKIKEEMESIKASFGAGVDVDGKNLRALEKEYNARNKILEQVKKENEAFIDKDILKKRLEFKQKSSFEQDIINSREEHKQKLLTITVEASEKLLALKKISREEKRLHDERVKMKYEEIELDEKLLGIAKRSYEIKERENKLLAKRSQLGFTLGGTFGTGRTASQKIKGVSDKFNFFNF